MNDDRRKDAMTIDQLTNPVIAAMLRTMGQQLPHWASTLEEAASRLCEGATRAEKQRKSKASSAHGVRTMSVLGAHAETLEGGATGGVVSDKSPLEAENKDSESLGLYENPIQAKQERKAPEVARKPKRSRAHTVRTKPPGFTLWWNSYPATRRKDSARCLEYWIDQGLEDRASEIVAATAFLSRERDWPREKYKFCPLSTTFLSQTQYEAAERPAAASPTPEPPKPARVLWTALADEARARLKAQASSRLKASTDPRCVSRADLYLTEPDDVLFRDLFWRKELEALCTASP